MKRRVRRLVCLLMVTVTGVIFESGQVRADTCDEGEYLCQGGGSVSGYFEIYPDTNYGLWIEGDGCTDSGPSIYAKQSCAENYPSYAAFFYNIGSGVAAKYGVYGYSKADNGTKYGVYGLAEGEGTNYGLFGWATGGTTNWAGYFEGDVNITGSLEAGSVDVTGSMTAGNATVTGGLNVGGDITGTSSTSDIIAGSSGNFRYTSARTFYYSVPSAVCVDTLSTTDDTLSRVFGYSYISYGDSSPHEGYVNCPVKLPDGATVTRVDCGIRDSDSSGYVTIYMYRVDMTGSRAEMAYATSGSASTPGDTTIYDAGISDATVDNSTYSYYIRVNLVASSYGSSEIRFNMCKVTFTMQDVMP